MILRYGRKEEVVNLVAATPCTYDCVYRKPMADGIEFYGENDKEDGFRVTLSYDELLTALKSVFDEVTFSKVIQ